MNTASGNTRSRNFHLSDILTVTTGVMISTRGREGLDDILRYMTGNSATFQMEAIWAGQVCAPNLLEQHPQLENIGWAPPISKEDLPGWLAARIREFGEFLPVRPIWEEKSGEEEEEPEEEEADDE